MSLTALVTAGLVLVGSGCLGLGWVLGRTYTPRVKARTR